MQAVLPTVRLRKLVAALRKHREATGLSITKAARQLGWSTAKLSRIESGTNRPKPTDVEKIMELYGVPSPERDALLALSRETDRRGWWTAFDPLFGSSFMALEDEAVAITSWEAMLVPGLLQTEEYAAAVISRAAALGVDQAEVARRVEARMHRTLLLRGSSPRFHALLGEAVIRQQVGGAEAMRRQLAELWSAACQPHITIQIVPFSHPGHLGLDGSVTLFTFDDDDPELDVAHVEGQAGPVYLESADAVGRARATLADVASAAMSPDASREMLAGLANA